MASSMGNRCYMPNIACLYRLDRAPQLYQVSEFSPALVGSRFAAGSALSV